MDDDLEFFDFDFCDYLMREFKSEEGSSTSSLDESHVMQQAQSSYNILIQDNPTSKVIDDIGMKKMKIDDEHKISFRTRSSTEIMADGFKWRKYGKKMVKDSSNPRNYYRCSNRGCNVKKRVQRDNEDSSFVITTYEGKHNHETPCFLSYNNQMPSDLIREI